MERLKPLLAVLRPVQGLLVMAGAIVGSGLYRGFSHVEAWAPRLAVFSLAFWCLMSGVLWAVRGWLKANRAT